MDCLYCTTYLDQPELGRKRKFCNDRCKIAYHRYQKRLPTLPHDRDHCSSCGKKSVNIFGDIDKVTNERYGYLCMTCGKVIEQCTNPARLRAIASYLERTHPPLSVSNERIRNYSAMLKKNNRNIPYDLKESPEIRV